MTDYITKAGEMDYKVFTREQIMTQRNIYCYRGTPNKSAEELEAMHIEQDILLRKRVEKYPGSCVVFTPDGDAEDFVLVGDDPQELARQAYEHECEIRGMEP